MRRLTALLLLALGCPSSPPPQETTPTAPDVELALDGQVLYAARPADEVPSRVSDAWDAYQQAWASEPPMPAEDAGVDGFRAFVTQQFAPYVDAQAGISAQLLGAWEEAANAEEKLFYSVLAARLLHRVSSWMWTLPLPEEGTVNESARQALETSMRGAAKDLAAYAHQAFGKCVEAAGPGAEQELWRADCTRRAESIDPIRTAQIGPPPPTPMPEGCEDHTDPLYSAPQHDAEARPQLLVLVEAEAENVDTDAVRRQVERWARSEHELRAVPAGRRRAAERLVEASKTSRRGPECAAAPSLSWVLGAQVENLVVASVEQACHAVIEVDENGRGAEAAERMCELTIGWHRAGSSDTEGLPPSFRRELPTEVTTQAVVESLSSDPAPQGGLLGALSGGGSAVRLRVAAVETNPGYRLRTALGDLDLSECQTERGASELQLGWTVTPTGAVESVTVQGGEDAVSACVREKLQQLAFPCTPSGDPIAFQTTLCLAR